MANTSGYSFAENTPFHEVAFIDNKDGLTKIAEVQGLSPFGLQTGVITEDKLTPSIVEFLLSKDEFKDYLVKDKKDAPVAPVAPAPAPEPEPEPIVPAPVEEVKAEVKVEKKK